MTTREKCRTFHDCEGCSHCSENPRRCEYCADPWDECLCDFQTVPPHAEESGDLFTACEMCGWFGIPIDGEGMATELCEECETTPPAVVVAMGLSELLVDLEGMNLPDMSGNSKANYLEILADAVLLLRTHAIPDGHPWAVK